MSEQLTYEYVPGGAVSTKWADRERVAIPPKSVRDALRLPPRFEHACFAQEMQSDYKSALLMTAGDYVNQFPVAGAQGAWLALLGESGAGKTYTAAAVANEIARIWYPNYSFIVHWLSVSELGLFFDYRYFRKNDEFWHTRKRIFECDLLIVDDLLHHADRAEAKELMFSVFDRRDQMMRPTIVTANANVTPDDWSAVEKAYDKAFARRLRQNAKGFTAVV